MNNQLNQSQTSTQVPVATNNTTPINSAHQAPSTPTILTTPTITLSNTNLQTKNIQIINNLTPTILNSIPQNTNLTFSIENTNLKTSNIKINQLTSSTFTVLPTVQQAPINTSTPTNNNQVTSSASATSTHSNNSNSSSTSSYGGFAYCTNCGDYGVKAAFYGKSKLYCSVACQNGIKKQQQQQQNHGVKRTSEALNYSPINSQTGNNQTILKTPQTVPILSTNLLNNIITLNETKPENTNVCKEVANTVSQIKSGSTTISNYLSQQINSTSNSLTNKINENSTLEASQTSVIPSSVILSPTTTTTPSSSSSLSSPSLTNSQTCLNNANPAKRARKTSISSNSIQESNNNISIINEVKTSPTISKLRSPIKSTFSWCHYIDKNNFTIAPVNHFKHAPLSDIWKKIMNSLKLEIPNNDVPPEDLFVSTPNNKKMYWFASVIQFAGYLVKLRYIGFEEDSSADFWMHMSDEDIRPVGWCSENNHSLVPPMKIAFKIENWENYVVEKLVNCKTIQKDFHKTLKDALNSKFKKGMILELVDKKKLSQMRVARIIDNIGGRLRLKYENANEFDDFWCHEKSDLIHPVGWSVTVGHDIFASDDYKKESAIKYSNNSYEPNECSTKIFKKHRELDILKYKDKFRVNMKLEAVDPLNLSSICVASVSKVLSDDYLMISIDGYKSNDGNDMFCYHRTSSALFPVGFCEKNNIPLQPPFNYKKEFNWSNYLKETKSEFAPSHLFYNDENTINPFKVGMKLESVDLIEPKMICVATVVAVVNRLIRLNFDGWGEKFDQWVDFESCDLYPAGWCQLVGYKLEEPPANDKIILDSNNNNTDKKKKKSKKKL